MSAFERKLMKSVKQQPIIYDIAHPLYYDAEAKELAWQQISEQILRSVADCKKKWQQLRTNLRKARMRRKKFTGEECDFKPWKYEKDLAFLERCNMPPEQRVNLPEDDQDDSNEIIQIFKTENSEYSFSRSHIPSPALSTPSPVDSVDIKERKRSRKQSGSDFFSNSTSSKRGDPMENDHIHKFFVSAEETFRRLPPESQVDAKVEMTLLLAKFEKLALRSEVASYVTIAPSVAQENVELQ